MEQLSSSGGNPYEDVNGIVPRGPPIDMDGLAQQVCDDGGPESGGQILAQVVGTGGGEFDAPFFQSSGYISNIGPSADSAFLENATREQELRRASGYTGDNPGRPGGEFTEDNPPPGFRFGGYLKGNIGIVWHPVDAPQEQASGSAVHGNAANIDENSSSEGKEKTG